MRVTFQIKDGTAFSVVSDSRDAAIGLALQRVDHSSIERIDCEELPRPAERPDRFDMF